MVEACVEEVCLVAEVPLEVQLERLLRHEALRMVLLVHILLHSVKESPQQVIGRTSDLNSQLGELLFFGSEVFLLETFPYFLSVYFDYIQFPLVSIGLFLEFLILARIVAPDVFNRHAILAPA